MDGEDVGYFGQRHVMTFVHFLELDMNIVNLQKLLTTIQYPRSDTHPKLKRNKTEYKISSANPHFLASR